MTGNDAGRDGVDVFEAARAEALATLDKLVGMVRACAALGVNRVGCQNWRMAADQALCSSR